MASTQLRRTNGTPTNAQKGTVSFWVKRSNLGSSQQRLMMNMVDGATYSYIAFNGSHFIQHYANDSTQYCHFRSNALFRDTSAWYHFVFSIDTTQSDADNRVRIYVNGEEITSWLENARPTQNTNHPLLVASTTNYHTIGASEANTLHFDGSMAHFHFIDGTQYPASTFGETDSTTGIWKPKTAPSVTYGNNGYFLDFADSSNMGNDVSGNNNDLTVSGTITQTIDTPSNVFAVWNNLMTNTASDYAFSYGNTKVSPQTNGSYNHGISTLGMKKGNGKYYCEIKWHVNDNVGSAGIIESNIANHAWNDNININDHATQTTWGRCVFRDDGNIKFGGTNKSSGVSMTNNDILGIAFDAENGKVYFHKNGTYVTTDSVQHNPSAGTGGIDISGHSSWVDNTFWHWYCGDGSSSGYSNYSLNAGNGYFETTAVASAGTNAGVGTFEYDVPTGFKALCTKNLNI